MKLTSNKPVKEMSMWELSHNCCYQKERIARYRDFETDIVARELTRELMKKHANIELSQDTDIFDDEILDMLCYGTDTVEGLIALFYRNLWAMADLREQLKMYEESITTSQLFYTKEKIINRIGSHRVELIKKIEKAIGFEFTAQQLSYIEFGEMRRTGITTAHIISLLINSEISIIDLSTKNIERFIEPTNKRQTPDQLHCFRKQFREIKDKLDAAGIKTTRVRYEEE